MTVLKNTLEGIAVWFSALGMPEPIVHWGHPAMMAIVLFVMGTFVGVTGWKGRTLAEKEPGAALESRAEHKKIAPLMYLFVVLGYSGGVLSLIMQHKPIFESPHFWTGSTIVGLLSLNALLAASKFGGGVGSLRTVHAYLGSAALFLFVVHAGLGLKLGLSI